MLYNVKWILASLLYIGFIIFIYRCWSRDSTSVSIEKTQTNLSSFQLHKRPRSRNRDIMTDIQINFNTRRYFFSFETSIDDEPMNRRNRLVFFSW